jgi:molybdenum cofactor cytidylyltransferase
MIAGILLAAGESKRFRPENKLLHKIDGVSVLEHLLKAFLKSHIDSISIVVGYQKAEITHLTKKVVSLSNTPTNIVDNQEYRSGGMSSSIIAGVNSIINSDAVLITPADIPFIPTNVINTLITYYERNKPKIIIPTCDDRKGHPILISSDLYPEVLSISEELRGLKEITTKYRDLIDYLPFEEKGIIRDIDTKEDLQNLR